MKRSVRGGAKVRSPIPVFGKPLVASHASEQQVLCLHASSRHARPSAARSITLSGRLQCNSSSFNQTLLHRR